MRATVSERRFTVDEFHRMTAAGILAPEDHVELVSGRIVQMAAIGSRHAACVARLTRLMPPLLTHDLIVWVQNPLRLDRYTELVPDFALLRYRADFYAESHPGPKDVLLLVEVADTTLDHDLGTKIPAYAAAGVPEVWLVDLTRERVERFSGPAAGSGFGRRQRFVRGERIAFTTSREPHLLLDELFG